jgi:hypothetical protein
MKGIILDNCGRRMRSKTECGVFPHFVNFDICTRNAKWKVDELVFRGVEQLS